MEIAMFGYTNYRIHIIQANNKFRRFVIPKNLNINHDVLSSNEGFEIIWNFGFDHFKRLMSVIVKCKRTGRIFLFTKGAFEAILNISDPLAIPSDFKTLAEKYSADGSYTIAVAYRDITYADLNNLEDMQRSIFEVSMTPLGILSFINIIRTEAADTVKAIQDSNIRCVVLTGDNLQSALSVARRIGLLKDNKIKDNPTNNCYVIPVENQDYITISGELVNDHLTLHNEQMEIVSCNEIIKNPSKYLLALTADAYNAMEDVMVVSGIQGDIIDDKQSLLKVVTLKDLIYSRIVIIARSSPEDKCKVVSDFTKYGEITGMIGDGSNDSAAMRVSHVGVTLTNHSTTVIAPFAITSNNLLDISNLIAEGHNCAVTSHSLYLYMLLSGIPMVFCKNILLYFAQANIPMMGYFYYDLVVNLPSMWSLIHCKTKKKLASYKPETSLISLNSLYTVGSIFSIVIIFYCVILFRASSQPWFTSSYTRNITIDAHLRIRQDGFEPAMTWLWLCFLHSHMSIVFGFGGDHREPFYKNKILLFTWSIAQLGLLWLTFSPPNSITCWFRVNCINEIPNYFSIFNLHKIEFVKFVAPAGHNVFPLSWKFEFTFWTIVAASFMGLSYYYFNSRRDKAKLKKKV
ncbi:E1-E2 ATPase family protein [Cryptosporidium serpentis]